MLFVPTRKGSKIVDVSSIETEREGESKIWNGDSDREFDFALLSERRMCVYFIKKNEVGVRVFVLEVREWRRRRQTKTSIVREDKNLTN